MALDTATASLAFYSFVSTITPGPNNLMLASSGSVFGLRRTVPHLAGIVAGGVAMFILCSLGLYGLFEQNPHFQLVFRAAGAGFMLYLALELWRETELGSTSGASPFGFWPAAAFQFVNPKAWIIILTAIATFSSPRGSSPGQLLWIVLIFEGVGIPCILAWALVGSSAKHFLTEPGHLRWFNRLMAALTAATAILIIFV